MAPRAENVQREPNIIFNNKIWKFAHRFWLRVSTLTPETVTFIARTCFHAYRVTHATRQDVGPTLSTGSKSQLGFCPVPLKWQFNQRGKRALMLSALLPHRKDAGAGWCKKTSRHCDFTNNTCMWETWMWNIPGEGVCFKRYFSSVIRVKIHGSCSTKTSVWFSVMRRVLTKSPR